MAYIPVIGGPQLSKFVASSGGAPGGSSGQVQYNNAGAFGGATGFTLVAGALSALAVAAAANVVPFSLTGYSVTGSGTSSMFNLAGTWNTSGVVTGFKLNITDTASDAASILADFQINGVSVNKIDKTGKITIAGGSVFRSLAVGSGSTNFDILNAHVGLAAVFGGANGTSALGIGGTSNTRYGAFVPLDSVFGFYDFGNTAPDVTLSRVSANILGINSGTSLQLGVAAVTGLGAGLLAALTNASITLKDSTGQTYRIPCII